MRIFHIATLADYEQARLSGAYRTSTLGRSLDDEGFIHASRQDQVATVFARVYSSVREPLVLLTIDTTRLSCEVREEQVGDDTYPHVYGPIDITAVVEARPLDRHGRPLALQALFVREMVLRMGLGVGCMALALVGAQVGGYLASPYGALGGAVAFLLLGLALSWAFLRRRDRRTRSATGALPHQ